MRTGWHFRECFPSSGSSGQGFVQKGTSQPGELFHVTLGMSFLFSSFLALQLTSNNTYSSYLVHLKYIDLFPHFLDI
jgi:hypothetical protein